MLKGFRPIRYRSPLQPPNITMQDEVENDKLEEPSIVAQSTAIGRVEAALIVATIFLAIIATVGCSLGGRYGDVNRRAQASVERLVGIAYRMRAISVETVDKGGVTMSSRRRLATCEEQAQTQIDTLEHMPMSNDMLRAVSRSYATVRASVDLTFNDLSSGRAYVATRADSDRMQKAYELFNGVATQATSAFDDAATIAANVTLTVSIIALVVIVLGLGYLLKSFDRRLADAAMLASERRSLRSNEARFHSLVANATDIILILDRAGIARYVSPATNKVLGIPNSSLTGTKLYNIVHHDDVNHARNIMDQAASSPSVNVTSELRLLHQNGSWRHVEVILINQLSQPEISGIIATLRDITERKEFEEQLTHHAFHDALTGLPNRALFLDRLSLALSRTARHENPVAIAFIDLDNFKVVNDSLGHQAGDRMLLEVTERIKSCLRPDDTLARLGGDEFVILIENAAGSAAQMVAERIVKVLDEPIYIEHQACFTSASIGIAMSENSEDIPQFLLRDADTAMYAAKTSGKGKFSIFDRSMSVKASERLEFESELRTALERKEIVVYYQPIVSLEDEHMIGLEALMRWNHPKRGIVSPVKFIPVAEDTGLIIQLGEYVLIEACRQLKHWQDTYPSNPPLKMSINLSPRQFQLPDIVDDVRAAIRRFGLDPRDIKLEITESVTVADPEKTCRKLEQLKAIGVLLAIDDFCTGYSSMTYLKSFPIDTIKIDRSFVSRLGNGVEDDAIVEAIITLAKTMRLDITGEGIETPDQLHRLQALGCDLGQGYLFAKPLTASDVTDILSRTTKSGLVLTEYAA